METQANPLLHKKKADLACDFLREQIVSGKYAPGQRITLAELAAACNMSNMPVREALVRLEREGLLQSEAHRGVRVSTLSLREIRELFAVRTELEGMAAAQACAAGDATLARDLEQHNRRFAEAVQAGDFLGMNEANIGFHDRLVEAAGNAYLARLLADIRSASRRYRSGYRLIPGRAEATVREHAQLIAAIAAGDPARARSAATMHIQHAGEEFTHMVIERKAFE